MLAAAGDKDRVLVLSRARAFKRSWIELAEALTGVLERGAWEGWGYRSFDAYCKKELRLTPSTAAKLTGSFRFLKTSAPAVIERSHQEPAAPVPDLKVIDFVAKAEERGAVDEETMRSIHRAAFEEGASAPKLAKRFKSVAFPVSAEDKKERVLQQVLATAKRLSALLAEAGGSLPQEVASAAEATLGQLLEALDTSSPEDDPDLN